MASSIPTTMKALIAEGPNQMSVKVHPVPDIADDEILFKTAAVALNPTDWKHVFSQRVVPGSIVGCDASGTVVKVGKDVTTGVKIGDHVAAFVHGSKFSDEGAFAEYVKVPAELAWVVPEKLKFEESATFGIAFMTPVQMLYHPANLDLVEPPNKVEGEEWILIYGGSSAVGQYAIQLAHLSGYKVVSTASPRNHDLVRSLGADVVFDYRDPDVVAMIKEATGDSIRVVFDTISEADSQHISAASLAPGGGKLGLILGAQPDAIGRDDVQVIQTLLYTVYGRPLTYGTTVHPAKPEDRVQMAVFMKNKLPGLVKDGSIKPINIKLWQGGISAIPQGLQYMRDGKVSAEKLVYLL